MNTRFRRLLTQIAFSACVAIVTPAAAAGLVEGVSAAATTVADATSPMPSIAPDSVGGAPVDSHVATRAPARLSALAGSDDAAWADAHSVAHDKRAHR
jgi:hypothetical protein